MNDVDVNELWSSPWRKLQKNLAGGFALQGTARDFPACGQQTPGGAAPSSSWLVRAHSLKAGVPRIIQ